MREGERDLTSADQIKSQQIKSDQIRSELEVEHEYVVNRKTDEYSIKLDCQPFISATCGCVSPSG